MWEILWKTTNIWRFFPIKNLLSVFAVWNIFRVYENKILQSLFLPVVYPDNIQHSVLYYIAYWLLLWTRYTVRASLHSDNVYNNLTANSTASMYYMKHNHLGTIYKINLNLRESIFKQSLYVNRWHYRYILWSLIKMYNCVISEIIKLKFY